MQWYVLRIQVLWDVTFRTHLKFLDAGRANLATLH